jgi:hypothetical protein
MITLFWLREAPQHRRRTDKRKRSSGGPDQGGWEWEVENEAEEEQEVDFHFPRYRYNRVEETRNILE